MGRAVAVVLFTDLVGSTELRGRLGEEAADELRRRHDQLLAQAVEANNGQVVKGLGDGIMATFAGAADAVAAAVAIQQGIHRHNRSGQVPHPVEVRVGLSAGDVALEDDDVHGTPVIEAARLCGAAVGGEILASEIVRWLAGAQDGPRFIPAGSLELKGLAAPVATVRIEWEPAPVSQVPMPTLLTDIGRIFVGRDGELERLRHLWKEAAAGERRVALLAGEPGVGKTRLAAELALRAHEEGGVVIAGRCDEDLGVPYQPFVEALRHFADHTATAELKERLGRYGGELTRLVPELTERTPDLAEPIRSDPETERYRLFDAVAAWLTAASAAEPLLLVLDDLQWGAKPTLMLLRHVVRAGGGRVLVLGTYRDTDLTEGHPLGDVVADLHRHDAVDLLSLTGLDHTDVRVLVERASGAKLDAAGLSLARAIHDETVGNPFFIREVLRHLAETGAVEQRDGVWTTQLPVERLGIPDGVRQAVGHRLSRLSGDSNQALRIAAVVGPEFELGVVQAAGGLGEDALLAAIEEAARARLVLEVSATRFRFAHALVRATLYESLTAARKVTLHRRVAEAIETIHQAVLDDHVPALAHHWSKAGTADADRAKAVTYLQRAGDRALLQLAHDEAAAYYTSGLALLDAGRVDAADPRRLELLIGRGEAQRRAGDPGYDQTLLAAARLAVQLDDAHSLARAALANTRGHMPSVPLEIDTVRIDLLEAAVAAMGEADLPVRARLLANLAMELAWQPEPQRRLALSREALSIATSLGEPHTLAHVLVTRDYTIHAAENAAERLTATAALLVTAEQLGDPVLASRALSLRFKAALELADVAEAERCLAANQALVTDLGQPALTWATMHHDATLRILRRDPSAAAAITTASDFGAPIGMPAIWPICQRFTLCLEQGGVGEFEETFRDGAHRTGNPVFRAALAHILLDADRTDDAVGVFDDLAATGFACPGNNVAWMIFATECAAVCARLRRGDHVPLLRDMLTPYAEQLVVAAFGGWVTGSVALYLAVLCTTIGDWDEAEAHFAAAVATHERIGAPAWLARTRVERARMALTRRQRGDTDHARELLGQALESARGLGLTKVERDAVGLLQDCR